MRSLVVLFWLLFAFSSACDVRSGIAKKDMEKYTLTPTPFIASVPTDTPVNPADIIDADTSREGPLISLNGHDQKHTATCTEFNQLMVNGDRNRVAIKGACRQIMINGDGNEITADAAMEFIFNGGENITEYSRYVNGKRPNIVQNRAGNDIEKVSAEATSNSSPQPKTKQ